MSVKDFKKQLDKCDAEHEQQIKDCTNTELETKEAMEKAEWAHGSAVVALKNAKETRISDRLKIAKDFIDNEIKVDLKLSKYDREDVPVETCHHRGQGRDCEAFLALEVVLCKVSVTYARQGRVGKEEARLENRIPSEL